jgi:hypothetical protein
MGFRRWCTVESKHFVMDVEGVASGLRIQEFSRGVSRSIFLNHKDSSWLLESMEELLSAKSSDAFWRRSRIGFPGIFAQRCANKHGRYLIVEDFGTGRRRGLIIVPEGRKGVGWTSFHSELSSAVKQMKVSRNMDIPPTRPLLKKITVPRASEITRKAELPESSHRRSFAEMVKKTMDKPVTILSRNATKQSKLPELNSGLGKEKMPVTTMSKTATKQSKLPEMNSGLVKEKMRLADVAHPHSSKPVAPSSVSMNSAKRLVKVPCQKLCLRETLERIRRDVICCLHWLDSGLSCGPLDSSSKPGPEIKKNKAGILGSRPKFLLKQAVSIRGKGQVKPKGSAKPSGHGLIVKPTRQEKGKGVLLSPKPKKPKPISKKWVKTHSAHQKPGPIQEKDPPENPRQGPGLALSADLTASTSAAPPSAASTPQPEPICEPVSSPVTGKLVPIVISPTPTDILCAPQMPPVIIDLGPSPVGILDRCLTATHSVPPQPAPICEPVSSPVIGELVPIVVSPTPMDLLCAPQMPPVNIDLGPLKAQLPPMGILDRCLKAPLSVMPLLPGDSEKSGLVGDCSQMGNSDFLVSLSKPLELPAVSSAVIPGWELAAIPDGEDSGLSVAANGVIPEDPLISQPISIESLSGDVLFPSVNSRNNSSMELELCSEDPSPLRYCPAKKSRGKAGAQSTDWVLHLVLVFSQLVGLSCDGYEGKLSALFEEIIASNSGKVSGTSSRANKKGMRELNNLFSSINYDKHCSGSSRGKNKVRDQKDYL